MRKGSPQLITKNGAMITLVQSAETVAQSKATVLITGESGTGKELLAQLIHTKSPRAAGPLVAINCAAVPENLLESELFGYERGAFTGAVQSKPGKFELADNGSFLLDEVSELPLALQAKLLRVLQEGEVERVGGKAPRKINVRLICTTNRPLDEMVREGSFRSDLFYRINVIPLHTLPLRERPEDIRFLSSLFIAETCRDNGLPEKSLAPSAWQKLLSWPWPGNVRELLNVIQRSALMCPGEVLEADDIRIDGRGAQTPRAAAIRAGMTLSEAEKILILNTLEQTGHNRTLAAQVLGISIRTLRNKINEYRNQGETL